MLENVPLLTGWGASGVAEAEAGVTGCACTGPSQMRGVEAEGVIAGLRVKVLRGATGIVGADVRQFQVQFAATEVREEFGGRTFCGGLTVGAPLRARPDRDRSRCRDLFTGAPAERCHRQQEQPEGRPGRGGERREPGTAAVEAGDAAQQGPSASS